MSPRKWLIAGGVFLGALGVAAPAHAAVTVIGSGMARDCYIAVEAGRLQPNKAIEICDLALEQERLTRKNRAATFVNRGILYLRMGNNVRAMADFDAGLKAQSDLYEAQVNRGAALYALQRYDEALEALNLGIRSDDFDARVTAYYNRGLTHEMLGDLTAAYYDYKAAVDLNPDFELASKQLTRFQVRKAP